MLLSSTWGNQQYKIILIQVQSLRFYTDTDTHTHTHTHIHILFSYEKEGNLSICINMGKTGEQVSHIEKIGSQLYVEP